MCCLILNMDVGQVHYRIELCIGRKMINTIIEIKVYVGGWVAGFPQNTII